MQASRTTVANRRVLCSPAMSRDESRGIDAAKAHRIAALAAIELLPDEAAALDLQIDRVLACIATLAELDLSSAAPTTDGGVAHLRLADDIVADSLAKREVFRASPECFGDFVAVAAFGAGR